MARRKARIDANHNEIVEALRAIGATVQSLATVGDGCPDILVGYQGADYLMEIKDGSKAPSKRRLTPDQIIWRQRWRGHVHIVNCVEDAYHAIGLKPC